MKAAVKAGDAKRLAELIMQDPGFEVNKVPKGDSFNLLHSACRGDSRSPVLPLLLAHPYIDVNVRDEAGNTPFMFACWNGFTSCVCELLKDPRVQLSLADYEGRPPIRVAAYCGRLEVIRWWIASGREMDLGTPGYFSKSDAIRGQRREA